MNGKMRAFVNGLIPGFVCQSLMPSPDETPAYVHISGTQTLLINKDDGSLSFGFSTDTFQMDVEEV